MKGEQGFKVLSHSISYLSGGLPVLEGVQGNKKRKIDVTCFQSLL